MKRTTFFKILTFIYVVVVGYLCFTNFESLPTAPGKFLGLPADKVVHFVMFFPFPLLVYLSFPMEKKKFWSIFGLLILIFAIGCVMAGITEYVQGKLPYRTMDIMDLRADMHGMMLATLICFLIWIFSKKHE